MRRRLGAGVLGLLLVTPFAAGGEARAATFTVNSALDATDGTCGAAPGECTLREAIEGAVATPGRDTIAFDPAVFPPAGVAPFIRLQAPLPAIADPAGTVIDGKGATVTVDGGGQPRALLFESAAGVPLVKVTVANLAVVNVAGNAIEVCGGESPACADDVTGVLLQTVAIGGAQIGIRIVGGVVAKIRVVGAVVSDYQGTGIAVVAQRALLGARVERTSVLGGPSGITLTGNERVVGATVVDVVASRCSFGGIIIQGRDITGTKIDEVVTTLSNAGGVRVLADGVTTKTTITNTVASAAGDSGVEVFGPDGNRGVTMRNVTAEGSAANGIRVVGPTDGATFTKLTLTNNPTGLKLDETGTGVIHAKLSDVVSADNMGGIALAGGANALKKIHVAANANAGMLLFGTGNIVEKSRAMGNGSGIVLDSGDSGASTIRKNVALGNKVDLVDDHPTCNANIWQKNVFLTASAPCIH